MQFTTISLFLAAAMGAAAAPALAGRADTCNKPIADNHYAGENCTISADYVVDCAGVAAVTLTPPPNGHMQFLNTFGDNLRMYWKETDAAGKTVTYYSELVDGVSCDWSISNTVSGIKYWTSDYMPSGIEN